VRARLLVHQRPVEVRVRAQLLDDVDDDLETLAVGDLHRLRPQADGDGAVPDVRRTGQRLPGRAMGSVPARTPPSRSSTSTRFIAGEPMKPATNTLAGRSYIVRGVSHCWARRP